LVTDFCYRSPDLFRSWHGSHRAVELPDSLHRSKTDVECSIRNFRKTDCASSEVKHFAVNLYRANSGVSVNIRYLRIRLPVRNQIFDSRYFGNYLIDMTLSTQ